MISKNLVIISISFLLVSGLIAYIGILTHDLKMEIARRVAIEQVYKIAIAEKLVCQDNINKQNYQIQLYKIALDNATAKHKEDTTVTNERKETRYEEVMEMELIPAMEHLFRGFMTGEKP